MRERLDPALRDVRMDAEIMQRIEVRSRPAAFPGALAHIMPQRREAGGNNVGIGRKIPLGVECPAAREPGNVAPGLQPTVHLRQRCESPAQAAPERTAMQRLAPARDGAGIVRMPVGRVPVVGLQILGVQIWSMGGVRLMGGKIGPFGGAGLRLKMRARVVRESRSHAGSVPGAVARRDPLHVMSLHAHAFVNSNPR
ncbi:MAG: hypothetical protein B7Z15_07945, partial [Rhizobiales bacterium 32-66-8]